MKIYHFITGILNPTKEDVLGETGEQSEYDVDETSDEKEQFSDSEEDEINENYQRREVTFVFKINPRKFLRGVMDPVWDKIKRNDDIMRSMNVKTFEYITKDATNDGWFICEYDNICEEFYDDVDQFNVMFMVTDQGIKVDCDVKKEFPDSLTEKNIGTMCEYEYDTFIYIEKHFSYGFSTPNCNVSNYDCDYRGGMCCNVCKNNWQSN